MSNRKELEKETKKRARHSFFLALLACFFMGLGSGWASFRTVCDISNPLRTFQCPSEGAQFGFGLIGGLILVLVLGLPFGYMLYNDTKWSLYGYKIPAKGMITRILWIATIVIEILPITFYFDAKSIPSWIGFTLLALIYIWFFFLLAYYSALKKQYAKDKKRKKLPKMKIIDVMEKERKINKEVAKNSKARKTSRKNSSNGYYDDGL